MVRLPIAEDAGRVVGRGGPWWWRGTGWASQWATRWASRWATQWATQWATRWNGVRFGGTLLWRSTPCSGWGAMGVRRLVREGAPSAPSAPSAREPRRCCRHRAVTMMRIACCGGTVVVMVAVAGGLAASRWPAARSGDSPPEARAYGAALRRCACPTSRSASPRCVAERTCCASDVG